MHDCVCISMSAIDIYMFLLLLRAFDSAFPSWNQSCFHVISCDYGPNVERGLVAKVVPIKLSMEVIHLILAFRDIGTSGLLFPPRQSLYL